jgi:Cof subfamily protein (haloacid dehalogenase superfamily)
MSLTRPKAIATDLDGTLLRSDGSLDDRSRRALTAVEAAGAMFVICTARPARWMRPLVEATGHRGVAICSNGGVLWDLHTESVLEDFPLDPEIAGEVVALLQEELPGGVWAVERSSGFGREPAYWSRWPIPPETTVAAIESLVTEPSHKLMFRNDRHTADVLLERARALVGDLAELSHSNSAESLIEIAAAGVSKATALELVCTERGISREHVVAFGDMPNDLAMLQWAGHAVAVANAHADVLAIADEVTAANDDAGVARVLERLFADTADSAGDLAAGRS